MTMMVLMMMAMMTMTMMMTFNFFFRELSRKILQSTAQQQPDPEGALAAAGRPGMALRTLRVAAPMKINHESTNTRYVTYRIIYHKSQQLVPPRQP